MKTKLVALLAVVAFAGLLFAPTSASAQSILLTAGDFALLGGTAVTNSVGATAISNGDVGSQVSVNGFPPGTVTGGSIIGTGAVVDQAILDLQTAHTGLANMTGATDMTGVDLSGQTLDPGVYTFGVGAAEITLSGTKILTLDAHGLNNVFWVFQIGTTLTTADGAQVLMINPGTNNGIFWNAGSGITFGANNTILGNYIAGTSITSGALNDGSGGSRLLALASITTDTTSIDALGGPSGSDWTGGLTYDLSNNVVPVPEPASTSVLIAGFMGLVIGVRRIRRHYSDRKLSI